MNKFLTDVDSKFSRSAYFWTSLSFIFSITYFGFRLLYILFNLSDIFDSFHAEMLLEIFTAILPIFLTIQVYFFLRLIIRTCENIAKIKFVQIQETAKREGEV